jgi:hypothetical protein
LVRLLEVEAVVLVCVEPVDELDPQAAMISEPATARRIGDRRAGLMFTF